MIQSAEDTHSRSWLDTLLLIAVALGMIFACLVLLWMAWQAPNVLAELQPGTPTPAIAQGLCASIPTAEPTSPLVMAITAVPTATSTATPTPIPPPTATHTLEPSPTPTATPSPTQPLPGRPLEKTIVIDLSEQTLTAYEDQRAIFSTLISAGQAHTPTPIGEFAIYSKVRSQTMSGPGYTLPNVEFVAYFYSAYAIHGTYWHDNFGHPMSHGCVNMRNMDAEWLYTWAPIGTPVSVRQ